MNGSLELIGHPTGGRERVARRSIIAQRSSRRDPPSWSSVSLCGLPIRNERNGRHSGELGAVAGVTSDCEDGEDERAERDAEEGPGNPIASMIAPES
jgi:hypothetical protein